MSVKTKLARQAVKTTAKHTAHGTASKFTRKPYRTVTLLMIGAGIGVLVGWLIGRSGGGDAYSDPIAQAPAPPSAVDNSTEKASETGAVS
jgi:ABC-type nitrate/sulfonate/bicarbonate transport system permease component